MGTTVGVRELRHRLRDYLGRAEAGETFEVTLYGRTVANLGPRAARWGLERLIEEGKVTPSIDAGRSRLPDPVPVTTGTSATEALIDERRKDSR